MSNPVGASTEITEQTGTFTNTAPANSNPPRAHSATHRADTLYMPLGLFALLFLLYALTATGFHTFDAMAYIRDMGKPIAAMIQPHHIVFEPMVLALYNLWRALGWGGDAALPAQVVSSLAGAGGIAMFYKLAWEWSRARAVSLAAALMLALSYGYWFYSVEIETYVLTLFFLLVALWLLARAVKGRPASLLWMVGVAQGTAALVHEAALFIVPAFALGVFLLPRTLLMRVRNLLRYGFGLLGIVVPAYLFAGGVVAGQNTPDAFLKWITTAGHVGTWGFWRKSSLQEAWGGLSAAVSSDFWAGRIIVAALLLALLLSSVLATRRGGPFAWTLWMWIGIYGIYFAWWDPENLKFWVLLLPAPLLMLVIAYPELRPHTGRKLAVGAGAGVAALLLLTAAPAIWARRDPMSDPERRVADMLARATAPEDLILLQAGNVEHYLPFYYNRPNVMSTRELWYLSGGAAGRSNALGSIRQRMWHALAKGSSVWIEDRVLTPGKQTADHYIFSEEEIGQVLSPYGETAAAEKVQAGPETFYKLSPEVAYSNSTAWQFTGDQQGWSGVNIAGEQVSSGRWCFAPLDDPKLFGPPVHISAADFGRIEIRLRSDLAGTAQLFYRATPIESYTEQHSISFQVASGEKSYLLDLRGKAGWNGPVQGLRLDPVEKGDVRSGAKNNICVESIRLLP